MKILPIVYIVLPRSSVRRHAYLPLTPPCASAFQVMLDPSDLEGLLAGRGNNSDSGDDDDSDEEEDGEDEGLQHHAGADAALGALIGLKKTGRKKGAQEAQRQGYQIRLRALDLLEVEGFLGGRLGEGENTVRCCLIPDPRYFCARIVLVEFQNFSLLVVLCDCMFV